MHISVRAKPRSRHNGVTKIADGSYVVETVAVAREGRANEAIRELLAKYFGVPKSSVRIIRGARSRQKIFEIQR